MHASILSVLLICSSLNAFARIEVDLERKRREGFGENRKRNEQLENERLSGIDEIKKQNQRWELQKQRDLHSYKIMKQRQAKVVDESGPDYLRYVQEQLKKFQRYEFYREQFAQEEKRKLKLLEGLPLISEEEEYGLTESEPRVDWKKRRFVTKPGSAFSGGAGSGSSYSDSSPGYSPPPPPAPVPIEPTFDEIPPPPPPIFDEEPPPIPPPPM